MFPGLGYKYENPATGAFVRCGNDFYGMRKKSGVWSQKSGVVTTSLQTSNPFSKTLKYVGFLRRNPIVNFYHVY
jgi:hypothetical protein